MLSPYRTHLPIADKNGMPNVSNTNGYSTQINTAGTSSRPYATRSLNLQQQQQQKLSYQSVPELRRIDDNVIRLPRGPDGTTGFMLKR